VTDVVPRLSLRGLPRRFEREHRWDVFPYSESGSELRQRVVAAVEGAIAAHGGERIAVVCHGGVINAYLTDALGLTADMVCHPAHASLSRVLALGTRRVVHSLNETGHLRAGPDLPDLVTY
jgi:broad specificity phosphatase PhoE